LGVVISRNCSCRMRDWGGFVKEVPNLSDKNIAQKREGSLSWM